MRKNINVLSPKFRTQEILDEIKECLDKGWTGMGFKTEQFEKAWKDYTYFDNAHFLNSNTVGLHLALKVFKQEEQWEDGDEVITTPLTFISTNHSILYENLTPVFTDVDDSLCLDPQSIIKNITPKTKAIIFVGIGGNIGKYNEVVNICYEHNIKLIFDAAHCSGTLAPRMFHGAVVADTQVGWDADATIFSFQAVKNLPTADSGMICFRDKKYDKIVRKLSWLGIDKDTFNRSTSQGTYKWDYEVTDLGYKYHGNSIMAAMGLVQLKYLNEDNKYRRDIAKWYDFLLSDVSQVTPIQHNPNIFSSRHLYQILAPDRDKLINYLQEKGIYPGVHYKDNTSYKLYKKSYGLCPKSLDYTKKLLTLPIHLNLDKSDCERVVKVIKEFYKKKK